MARLFLEGGEGGVQQLHLLMQLTTRREFSMVRLFLRVEREEYNSCTCDAAHYQEEVQLGEFVLEVGEGGVQQLHLLMQLTTRRESSMVRLFLEVKEGGVQQLYLLMQLTTKRESSMVRLFLRVEREESNNCTC